MTKRPGSDQCTLLNYTKRFLENSTRGNGYEVDTKRFVDSFCTFMHRSVRINELSAILINAWVQHLIDSGLCAAEVQNRKSRLSQVWVFAYERGDNHNPPPMRNRKFVRLPRHPLPDAAQFPAESMPGYSEQAGRAVVTINGVLHDLGEAGTDESKIAHQRLLLEFEASGRATHFGTPTDGLTVGNLIRHFRHYAKSYYGVRKGRQSEYTPLLAAVKYLGVYLDLPACDFGPKQLQAVRMRMVTAGCCRKVCNSNKGRIVRMFRWAVSQELILPHVVQGLEAVSGWQKNRCPARETLAIGPVDPGRVDATLPHLHPIVRAMVELQRLTGCRPAEVCMIRPCDIDRSVDVWVYRPAHHKTEHRGLDRLIYIGPKGQDILRPFLLRPAESCCFSPLQAYRENAAALDSRRKRKPRKTKRYPSESKRVEAKKAEGRARAPKRFPGESYRPGSYRNAIKRACLSHGIASWNPNQLRHLAATEIRKKFGIEGAQIILGHTKADVTQIYAERDSGAAIKIAREVG